MQLYNQQKTRGVVVLYSTLQPNGIDDPEQARAVFGAEYRTARRLFDGRIYYRPMKQRAPASILHAAAEWTCICGVGSKQTGRGFSQ
ncbi:hypothetical protein [Bradyrhizobium erythrophlei]|uniref:Uncharacterized protein n=1 Tax=Bradyrhizobium erythrophlei TaxID=1437360 RepID=A0A1H4WVA4_9BRAD|nr:hypothetical protein [Bradyrhizobium erythrophlei]SEC97256.1 hypothetical protein SAMN05444164_3260 [Bradyrhizobium erythrophlei]